MPEELAVSDGPELSQVSRVVNTFVAPSRTFTDILRSANCWLPLVLMAIVITAWAYAIDTRIGFQAVTEQAIAQSSRQSEAMQSMEPAARAHAVSMRATGTKIFSYIGWVMGLLFIAVEALVLWGTFNFALGARTTYPKVFAVIAFAGLPRLLIHVLSTCLILAGVGTENFDMQQPVGTNLGYYLTSSPKWLQAVGGFFDVFGLWSLVLLILGMAIISRKTISQSATVILAFFVLGMICVAGIAAAFS